MTSILRRIGILVVLAFIILYLPASAPSTLSFKVYREASQSYFNVLTWMVERLVHEVSGDHGEQKKIAQAEQTGYGPDLVRRYVELNGQISSATPGAGRPVQPADREKLDRLIEERDRLEPQAQAILRLQVEEVLRDEGFESSFADRAGLFPPPLFAFTALPYILVVSPRDRISTATTLALKSNLTVVEAESIEDRVSRLNLSALVVPIGGLGAYPPMIPRTSSLEFLAKTIPHEWMHNYLTFRPLGFRYSLQMETNYEIVTVNESTASVVGEEIGDLVLSKFYGYTLKEHPRKPATSKDPQPQPHEESDFARRMRAIRLKVDDYLSKGQIVESEKYMKEEQIKLQADGYDIRKLNQAYFAFHGSYATSPGFTNPLGDAVAELRYQSPSLKAFVDRVAVIGSATELKQAVLNAAKGIP